MSHVTNMQITAYSCVIDSSTLYSTLLAAVFWLPVFVLDVVEDVSLAVHQHGLSCDTSDAYWSDAVLVESEALLQSVSSHVFIEDVAAGEIQNATVVLVFGDEPDINTPVTIFLLIFITCLQLADAHELCVPFGQGVSDKPNSLQMVNHCMEKLGLLLSLRGVVGVGQQYINITTRRSTSSVASTDCTNVSFFNLLQLSMDETLHLFHFSSWNPLLKFLKVLKSNLLMMVQLILNLF